jgi:transposase
VEKGGLAQALTAIGIGRATADAVAWSDEMRLGLHGQVRRRWAPRGIKLRQRVEVKYEWRYLALAVSATGQLRWRWLASMKKEGIAETVSAWKRGGITALVWDSAPAHRARIVHAVGLPLVPLPPYSPELNPAERVFEELRRLVEGRVWGTVEAKTASVEALLQDLASSPERVRRLAGWAWIHSALSALPLQPFPAPL